MESFIFIDLSSMQIVVNAGKTFKWGWSYRLGQRERGKEIIKLLPKEYDGEIKYRISEKYQIKFTLDVFIYI